MKSEALPVAIAAGDGDADVIDVDADWCSHAPADFSQSIQLVLQEVASPPHNVASDVSVSPTASVAIAVASCSLPPPSTTNLPLSKLQSAWVGCVLPVMSLGSLLKRMPFLIT